MRKRLLGGLALACLAAGFAWLNGGQRVDLHFGLFQLRSVSFPIVVFVAFLGGMVTLLLASLRTDLRTRRMLTRYREMLGGDLRTDPTDAPDKA